MYTVLSEQSYNSKEHFGYIYGGKIREGVDEFWRRNLTDTTSTRVLMNLILVADWLDDIIAIHRGLHRDGHIIEIIPAPWHHNRI